MRKQNFKWEKINLGTCYYPEHWDKSLWESDLERMLGVGIETVRVSEFAWSYFEAEEGVFNFDFFQEFLDLAEKKGMKVIFCTPTATPPAWLTTKYPEVLNANIDGVLYRHGARRHYNYNSPVYQNFSKIIVEKIGEHYGKHPAIIGWQLDNEFNCEMNEFYSESDTIAFRDFLKEKYGTLTALNKAWGVDFWNQRYTAWEEVFVPRTTVSGSVNPHEVLDYKRFISHSAINYCKLQSDILRKYIPEDVFITTNGMFDNLDNHKMTDDHLDVYTYDSYPNIPYDPDNDPKDDKYFNDRKWSHNLSEVRSICKNFGIMEQQSGASGWNTRMETIAPKPGQAMLWAMQSIAHGADYVSFFRWRTCTFGTEIYWHGILNYDNCDNRRIKEIGKINDRVKKIENIAGADVVTDVAILRDYSNIWNKELDVWHDRVESSKEVYFGGQISHTPMDYLFLLENTTAQELLKYKVLFYTNPVILSKEKTDLLEEYVKEGGTLVVGCRAGMKDENGICPMIKMPGLLANLTGTSVDDFTLVAKWENPTAIWNGEEMEMPIFNDILTAEKDDVKVLATYKNAYYEDEIAMTERPFGKGKVIHFGASFTRDTAKKILEYLNISNPLKDIIEVPVTCEVVPREKDGEKFIFVLNYMPTSCEITLKETVIDMDSGEEVTGKVELSKYETKVYAIK